LGSEAGTSAAGELFSRGLNWHTVTSALPHFCKVSEMFVICFLFIAIDYTKQTNSISMVPLPAAVLDI